MVRIVVAFAVVLASAPAAADPDARSDAGWQLYDEAFAALAADDRAAAAALIKRLVAEHPGHPSLAHAGPLLALLEPPPAEASAVAPEDDAERQSSNAARAELAIFQTIHGVTAGVELCFLVDCDDEAGVIGLGLLGGVAGLAGSLLATSEGLLDGQRALINSGTFWGAANAGLILVISEPEGDKTAIGGMLLGQALGTIAGAAIASVDEPPTSGQVALANSGGVWLGAIAGLSAVALDDDISGQAIATAMLIGADLGIAAGAYVASRVPRISRAQSLLYDAGGIVGGLAGAGGYVLATNETDDRAVAGLAAAGAALGIGVTAYLTRRWLERD